MAKGTALALGVALAGVLAGIAFAKDEDRVSPRAEIPIPREKPANLMRRPLQILRTRYGGEILTHVLEAQQMLNSGKRFRVRGDQYSAAAMQVLFIESQAPERICADRRAKLHFHLSYNLKTKTAEKEPDWSFVAFIGPDNLERLGKLPQFGKGWKTVKAVDFLGACRK
jgi:hypothetical protein